MVMFIFVVQVPPLPELKLTVVEAPGSIPLEEPFAVTCRITNTTYVGIEYRIARKFGEELNLAVWRSILQPPN